MNPIILKESSELASFMLWDKFEILAYSIFKGECRSIKFADWLFSEDNFFHIKKLFDERI